MSTDIRFSLIIPVYRNEANLPSLLASVSEIQRIVGADFEAVFVVDGSPDDCYNQLKTCLPQQTFQSQLLLHSRNFGSFAAIRTGLRGARGQYMATMAADLQEPPQLVLEFFQILERDEADVVVGARISRQDPVFESLASRLFWWCYKRLVNPELPDGGVDVFGCNAVVRRELLGLEEAHSSLVGQIYWLGFRRRTVLYHRRGREIGRSGWTFRRKLNYLLDSLFAFSDLPVKALLVLGASGVIAAVVFGLALPLVKLRSDVPVPGYAVPTLAVLFFGSLNLMGLGIVGSYVCRAYGCAMRRPLAVSMRSHVFAGLGFPDQTTETASHA